MACTQYERLTALDSSFLAIENHNAHMHVGSVGLLDPRTVERSARRPRHGAHLGVCGQRVGAPTALRDTPKGTYTGYLYCVDEILLAQLVVQVNPEPAAAGTKSKAKIAAHRRAQQARRKRTKKT